MKKLLYILLLALFSCGADPQPLTQTLPLSGDWTFSLAGSADFGWLPAQVPGTVHTDLLNNGKIPDPFWGSNETDLQWIGQNDWVYRKSFHVEGDVLKAKQVDVVFEGLDTHAEVFLNGDKILAADNMFRRWQENVEDVLVAGENVLEVRFASAEQRFLQDSLNLGYPLPGGRWVFSRKAAYHFGWDWGPRFVTAGIWKPVYLTIWKEHKPQDVQLYTLGIDDHRAQLRAELFIQSLKQEAATVTIRDEGSRRVLVQKNILLDPEQGVYEIDFAIPEPKLWWTHDLGEPHLYDLHITVETAAGFSHTHKLSYGLRTIEVITEPDNYGESFYFKLNGIPVFMKGANYIPQDSFLPRVEDGDYLRIIQDAMLSNLNMIRVWGGGVYERDIFYDLCDKYGILVWQDFMFACAMYPGDDDFTENVKQEAKEQVRRLRNHASLALWCGNNEVDEGWHNWQWQRSHNIHPRDSATIWEGYERVFHGVLPQVVESLDPGRFYLPTSPMHGWGRQESLTQGSAHYWGVWWGMEPFEIYLEKVPRFMSEFGFQAMPALSAIRTFLSSEEEYLFSGALKSHQKHPTGYQTIFAYLEREALFPVDLPGYLYASQLIQAHGVGMAVQAHRASQPRCMGTLYWQLNDCWPVTSWSGMDVNHNWKALQYKLRTLYDDVMVSMILRDESVEVKLVSGLPDMVEGMLEVDLVGFDGSTTRVFSRSMGLPAGGSKDVLLLPLDSLEATMDVSSVFLQSRFVVDGKATYENRMFLMPFGQLNLPDVDVRVLSVERKEKTVDFGYDQNLTKEGYAIHLHASDYAAHVQLYLEESHGWFEDNFFHLLPGDSRVIFCQSDLSPEEFKNQLKIYHLNALTGN